METSVYYVRPIDAGAGRQNVRIVNGIIVEQWLEARNGRYTGPGNPEWVGQPRAILRGRGFRRRARPLVFEARAGRWVASAAWDEFGAIDS